jgi:hypothetical protein
MYANQGKEIVTPEVDRSEADCITDFELRFKKRTQYPGACSLDYQAAMQDVSELLGWDYKRNCRKGIGMYERCDAFARGNEEQGRGTLHGHCLFWLRGFDKVRDSLFEQDPDKRQRSREEMEKFVDKHFCSNYEYSSDLEVTHNQCHKIGKIVDVFEEVDDQNLRDCRSESLRLECQGKIQCMFCKEDGKMSDESCISTVNHSNMALASLKKIVSVLILIQMSLQMMLIILCHVKDVT